MSEFPTQRFSRLGVVAQCSDHRLWLWQVDGIRWQWEVLTGALSIRGTVALAKQAMCMSIAEAVAYTAGVRDGLICKRRGGLPNQT